ncbi:unnamed protein product (macronuclear) [Paramecium tetraurelia]|uniref:Uncharacterized protein n=2 Tax=Paramecium TaxID=5884 RepID=A0E2E2_PARTE|nr:uncharacterized protein GSPATT00022631001 [Paramecium tetraurelia]CAD8192731.1 unnamed protein product [Paramecium octaurelia]CAK89459.1 unnamed protein product [Paramecium tetraurelia]|eukprot:XP_001456856.1 hypothetical protein (macronuclear) [Paramecium tetraurelia strain d4-2]
MNFAIAFTALCFQALVLYPCHDTISEQVDKLEKNIVRLEQMEVELKTHMERNQELIKHRIIMNGKNI